MQSVTFHAGQGPLTFIESYELVSAHLGNLICVEGRLKHHNNYTECLVDNFSDSFVLPVCLYCLFAKYCYSFVQSRLLIVYVT